MRRADKEAILERNRSAMAEYVSELTGYTAPLTKMYDITLQTAVTSADVTNEPSSYYAGSVGQTKVIATFETEALALAAKDSNSFENASTLITYKYPSAGIKLFNKKE